MSKRIDFRDRANRVLKLNTKTFGESVTYFKGDDLIGFEISGIFDHAYEGIDAETEKLVSGNAPILGVNTFDFDDYEPKEGDRVLVRNVLYTVVDAQEDGQAGVSLFLHRVNHEQKVYKKRNS